MSFSSSQNKLSDYQPALDGLRAVAIIWVLLHNGAFEQALSFDSLLKKLMDTVLNSGWMGVQLFFVLSGFLITGILVDAKSQRTPNLFRNFYMRRVVRIFPIYYLFLFATFIASFLVMPIPDWLGEAYTQKWWFFLYLNNWVQPFQEVGFAHLWSLAVEEQFYLFWPIIVIALSTARLYLACLLMVIVAIAFRVWMMAGDTAYGESAAYVMTFARIDALALGALLAIFLRQENSYHKIKRTILFVSLVAGLYFVVVLLSEHGIANVSSGWPILNQSFAAMLFVALIYYSLNLGDSGKKAELLQKLLSVGWLCSIGRYSYAIYIFHLPISHLLHEHVSVHFITWFGPVDGVTGPVVFILDQLILFGSCYLLAWCSWRIVEKPFLAMKHRWPMTSTQGRD